MGTEPDYSKQDLASQERAEPETAVPAESGKETQPGPAPVSEALASRLDELPSAPGVYLFRNAAGVPIYIGKATSLRQRVRSYFTQRGDGRLYYPFIVAATAELDWIVTANAKEALLLENTLIKQHRPRYNVKLVDDKNYLSIKITRERFPRAQFVRRQSADGARYFGPYGSAAMARKALDVLHKHFRLRTCSNPEFRQRTRACIEYEMGRCGGPCVGLQSEVAYAQRVTDVVAFLKGNSTELISRLRSDMEREAAELNFEQAGRLRDAIAAIEHSQQRQHAVGADLIDCDVFGVAGANGAFRLHVLHYRGGSLSGSLGFDLHSELSADDVLSAFVQQFYASRAEVPAQVLVPRRLEQAEVIEDWLSDRRTGGVVLVAPQRGNKRALVALASANAESALKEAADRAARRGQAVVELQETLGLASPPEHVACVDVSSTGATDVVGVVVTMTRGELSKSGYRKFKIRELEDRGDVQWLAEVVERYLRKITAKGRLPQLLLVDGGLAHRNVAAAVVERLQLGEAMVVVGIAKARSESGSVVRGKAMDVADRLFLAERAEPVVLAADAPALMLVQELRDEAHRFALGYHRRTREKSSLRSQLEAVSGIGPKRRRALLQHFGTMEAVAQASVDELAAVPGVSLRQAELIKRELGEDHRHP